MVQGAFKRLALKYHPDRNAAPDAHCRMQELNEAYAIIGDPFQLGAYDRQRQYKITAQRQADDEAHYQAEVERRAEAARRRTEHTTAQRRAEPERHTQRRAPQPISGGLNTKSKFAPSRPRSCARSANGNSANMTHSSVPPRPRRQPEPAPPPIQIPFPSDHDAGAAVQPVDAPDPIGEPRPGEDERRQMALQQSCRALQNEIFKLDYGITDAAERVKYWQQSAASLANRGVGRTDKRS